MVVLHVAAPAAVGGLERVVEALAAGHAERGLDVHVAAVLDRPTDSAGFLAALTTRGVTTHTIVAPGRAYLRERAAVRALCGLLHPDVVHTHGYRPDVVDAGLARGLGIRTVTTVHGFTGGGWKNRLLERIQVRAFRRFDAVVAVSRPLADQLRRSGIEERRLRTIVNAWSPQGAMVDRAAARRALGLGDAGPTIVWLGRLTREKGADVALEMLARLRDVRVSLSVIGGGSEREALASRAAALGVADRVRWHGAVPDAGLLLTAFDAFVLSSRTEGTPIALFEAIEAGVPVVATTVGGVPDVVTPDEALLVPSEEADALALGVRDVLAHPAAAAERAAAAKRRLARMFAREPWLAAYEALYSELSDARRQPA